MARTVHTKVPAGGRCLGGAGQAVEVVAAPRLPTPQTPSVSSSGGSETHPGTLPFFGVREGTTGWMGQSDHGSLLRKDRRAEADRPGRSIW